MEGIREYRKRLRAEIVALLRDGKLTYEQIARHCSCAASTVYTVASEYKLRRSDRAHKASGQERQHG